MRVVLIAASLVAVASALTSSLTRPGAFARRHQRAAPARRRPPRSAPTMLFLDECVWKENALAWAKETSRTKFERPAVVALFDRAETCVYVGAVDDAAFAVAALAAKHGTETIAKLKREDFPKDVYEDPMGRKMMDSLVKSWTAEATLQNRGDVPCGNLDAEWGKYDKNSNPFLAGVFGATESGDAGAPLTEEEVELDKMQRRRENMKRRLDEAIEARDESTATKLLTRLSNLTDDLADEPEAADF